MDLPPLIPDDIRPHDGRFVGGKHFFACRVYFEDTDFSGIVYHANYLRYMERARSDMLRQLDMDQHAAYESGDGVYAVVDLTMKYWLPAKLDDDLVVVSTVETLRAASVIIDQTILRGSEIITSASVHAAFLTPAGRPRRQPKAWTKAFASVMNQTDTK
ncbi:MAG: YbgC/FadM family acyl-CoA thioesterase [Sphingomonadales bacterium]|nr:YbgC/FadM family acyl-CoA thioesterase [Sphingomonadales bacterium]PIX67726.1 MAG: thioesterase [Sphingomonadales bacterium CG_4_10_14_3_um_filter_58_15]NCO49519.1 YbgC/FadM family acyl-CoA thioesterase [Sphingomonadales bacterium]NCP01112.1 YbgC/FadM family acyl-CoA thioesterase [Sphingomonadales bacterium]NCP25500.1 YbgC/FadM family acyl-CoA thioesterase [Sphingomonadales bacterium]